MNNPKFIYSSSPDRGLDTLLNLWLQIRKEFPDAELHVYYGFGNWDKAISQRNNENEKRLRDQILENMKQPGIFYHGRVNQDELAKDFLNSDIWAYPTRFWETYGITALESMISRTAIVCSDLAGLKTTIPDGCGIKVEGDAYTKEYQEKFLKEVFDILKNDKRRSEMLEKAYQHAIEQTWENRAKSWQEIFNLEIK